MKKKKTVKTRMLSLFLVLLLLTGSVSSVRAEEAAGTEAAGSETTKEQIVESEESVGSGEQGNVPGSAESTDGSADVKKDEEASSDRNVSAPSAVKKEAKATTASDEDKTEAAGAGESEEPLTGYGITVTLQIEGYEKTVEEGVEVTMPDKYKTFEEYGIENVADPAEAGKPGYTVLHVMAEYCEKKYGKGTAGQHIKVEGGMVTQFVENMPQEGLMYLRNYQVPAQGMSEEKVQKGDFISIVDICSAQWLGTWTAGHYSWFQHKNMETEAGKRYSVKLNMVSLFGDNLTLAGAVVKVLNKTSGAEVASGTTNAQGEATIVVEEPGTYVITAKRRADYYDKKGNLAWNLVPPHGILNVIPAKEMTDAGAVAQAKETLSLGDISQVKENLTLPEVWDNKTTITWSSSDVSCIQNNGTVVRPVGADKQVTLTATISRGAVSDKKEFVVTVLGKALFKELQVDHGELCYDKSIDEYTIYVEKNIETLTIKGVAGDGVNVVKLNMMNEKGTAQTETVLSVLNPAFEESSYLISEDGKDLLPYDIVLETKGVQGTVTIHVKRGTAGAPLPDLPDITWGQHLGDKNNNAVVDSKAPINKTELLWESFSNAPDSEGSVYAGTPILVNNHIYAVRNHKIEMLDAKTGEVKASTKLYSQIGYYSNIIYGGGMIFVPLGNGDVQCFNATTLKSMYLIENPASLGNSWGVYGAMHYDDGKLYVGYSNQGDYGGYAVYDTLDPNIDDEYEVVEPLWMTGEEDQSYYGAGAVTIEDMVVIGGDGGVVSVRNAKTGEELSKLQLSGKIRCSLVYADGYIWTTTQGKKIYKLLLSESGKITVAEEADLPNISNASPVVTGGKVYITGGVWGAGFFAVYDMNLTLLAQEKGENPFYTPTVSTAYDNVCVYFTENGPEGSLYMAEVTANNKITLTKIYTPEHQQYSMSKVIIGSDGTIYYTNDSGYLFAIRGKSGEVPEKPDGGTDLDGGDGGKDDGADDKDDGNNDGSANDNTAGATPSLKPDKKPTATVSAQSFAPRKRTVKVNAATKNDVSSERNIVKAIQQSYDKKEKSLTIKNPPEVVGAEVFKQLAQYPEFRLVFDCGAYTLSMKGSDVTNVNTTLTTKLLEMENTLSEEDAERYGNYQRLMFAQEGPLPGKITVVYKLGEQFEQSEALYLYDLLGNTEAQEVILQKPYGMFVLENGGEFILSDQKVEEAQEAEVVEISEEIKPVNEKTTGIPVWIYLFIGLGAGALISGLITVKVMNARKRKDTWEK